MSSDAGDVNILIVDDDSAMQHALQHVFDSEGWHVSVVPIPSEAMRELARGRWALVVVNVALTDLTGPLFTTLKTLAQADALPEQEQRLLRVLFLVPTLAARWAQPVLEREGLPFVGKPFHLHDLLQKVSDLLMETKAIPQPIRDTRLPAIKERKQRDKRFGGDRGRGQMFASREDYMMTEEEIADYERQEEEARKKRQESEKKRDVL